MNFIKTKFLPSIIAIFTVFAMSGCDSSAGNKTDNGGEPIVPSPNIKSIVILPDEGGLISPMGTNINLVVLALAKDDSAPQDITKTAKWESDNPEVTVTEGVVSSAVPGVATITASYAGYQGTRKVKFTDATFTHLEIQEGWVGDGEGKVITNTTQEIEIVYVDYDPVSAGAYYPTLWAVYDDGFKDYVSDKRGAVWQSSDQAKAQVNTTKGSFVFGRANGTGIDITAKYKGAEVGFKVDVVGTRDSDLLELAFVDGETSWGCDNPKITTLSIPEESSHQVQACGKFIDHNTNTEKWIDVNANVIWKSSAPGIARVRQTINSKVQGLSAGAAVITIGFDGLRGELQVQVVPK